MKESSDTMQEPGQSGRGSGGAGVVVVVVVVVVGRRVVRGGILRSNMGFKNLSNRQKTALSYCSHLEHI